MGAAVTATSLSSGRLPQSCRCTRRRSIFVIGSAATFPGSGVGDGILARRASHTTRDIVTRQNGTTVSTALALTRDDGRTLCPHRRRGHRYSEHPSNHTISIDYRDRRSVNYLDHSHEAMTVMREMMSKLKLTVNEKKTALMPPARGDVQLSGLHLGAEL